jgi:hypothetical protein
LLGFGDEAKVVVVGKPEVTWAVTGLVLNAVINAATTATSSQPRLDRWAIDKFLVMARAAHRTHG